MVSADGPRRLPFLAERLVEAVEIPSREAVDRDGAEVGREHVVDEAARLFDRARRSPEAWHLAYVLLELSLKCGRGPTVLAGGDFLLELVEGPVRLPLAGDRDRAAHLDRLPPFSVRPTNTRRRTRVRPGLSQVIEPLPWSRRRSTVGATDAYCRPEIVPVSLERCESGRIGLTANESTWKLGPRVQIPPSPLVARGQATTYDGSSWSVPVQADSYAAIVNEVSCASSSFCVAVDAENYAFVFAPTTAAITTSTSHPRLGQSISIGVKVSGRPRGVGAKTPTGKVIVKEASTTLCVTALSTGKGSCRLSTRRLGAGKYHLAATYSGSADYGRSVSRPTTLTVAKAISATVLKLSTAKLTEGSEQAEHLSVTVSPQHAGLTPTGKVTVKEAAAALCVIKLSTGKGSCRLSTRRLGAGKYHLVATYSGSADFGSSASASKTLTVTK